MTGNEREEFERARYQARVLETIAKEAVRIALTLTGWIEGNHDEAMDKLQEIKDRLQRITK